MTARTARTRTAIGGVLLLAATLHPVAAQTPPTARPEDVGMSSARLARLAEVLDGYAADQRLAGGALIVLRDGKVAFHHAFGFRDREAGSRMTTDAIFRIASQTKALVSVATMMLQEEGKLLISDPVSKYIPEFARTTVAVARDSARYDVVPARRQVTIRDLLTHSAGIGYGWGPARDRWEAAGITMWYFADRDEPVSAVVARMASLPMDAQPGERWLYGYGTDILGVVVEKVAGMPLDRFLRERITGPLRMNDTHFFLPPEKRGRLTAVYAATPDGRFRRAPDDATREGQGAYVDGPRVAFSGGAGLLSTTTDYARFLQMMLDGGELDGVRILSPKTVQLMTTDHVGAIYTQPGRGFGLGFETVDDIGARGVPGSFGEFGWGGAYHSSYWVDPAEELVVVYLTQLLPAGTIDDFGKVPAMVYGALSESRRARR